MASGNFKVKVDINPVNEILKRHGLQNEGAVTLFLRGEVDRLSDDYIPFKSGTLSHKVKSYPNNHSIKYNAPYARYQYFGKVMIGKAPKKATNKDLKYSGAPKRGAKWDKRMVNDKIKEICDSLEAFIRQYGR